MRSKAAIVRHAAASFSVEQIEIGELRDDEMLIRITGVGVCHTDLICRDQVYPVPLPVVLGHEGSGIVEQVGKAVTRFAPGDAVVLSYRSCGNCINCKRGEPAHCLEIFQRNFGGGREDGTTPISQNGQPVHGCFFSQSSFSEYAIAHESNAVKVPSDVNVPLELLGPLGCGIQSGAGAVINSLNPRVASSLVVFGCGSVGVAAVIAARLVGCRTIIAVDPKRERRELAMELGATHSLDPVDTDPVANIQEITIYGADYSLECTGLPHVFRHSVDCLAVNGTCGLIGAAPPGTEVTFDMNSIMFGRKVMGIIEGDSVPDVFIPELIHLFDQGLFPLDKLITTYPLDEIERAVADMESGKVLKPVLIP